ncbi:MAG: DnaD domain protein [Chloroflexi bacterium]|nr:DnaD domain protein [Chloroflexota bacterium]
MTEEGFSGFPARVRFTPLPNLFFSQLLPSIGDMGELKVTLHVFWLLYQKRGYPRYVTCDELAADVTLMRGLRNKERPAAEALRLALELAMSRGSLLRLALEDTDVYFLNDEAGRQAVARVRSGELSLGTLPRPEPVAETEVPPNIFQLYEANIGLLTPLIADELRQAEADYPAPWIREAFAEAAALNKRSWRYISRILERWAREGRQDGKPGRHPKEKTGPQRYLGGKYGHLVGH